MKIKRSSFTVVMYTQRSMWIYTHIAAAKSLQSCPTLCDPIDGSPTGSPVPGILQARTLEWVAISFSNAHITTEQIASQPGVKPLLILALLPPMTSLSPPLQPSCHPARLFSLYFTHIHPRKHLRAPTREGRRLWRLRGRL